MFYENKKQETTEIGLLEFVSIVEDFFGVVGDRYKRRFRIRDKDANIDGEYRKKGHYSSRRSRDQRLLIANVGGVVEPLDCAELVIQIPEIQSQENSTYRLDYSPPFGRPAPNSSFSSRDLKNEIKFSGARPGTKYEFWLYYSNSTKRDLLTWTASITTGNTYI
ncbi:hypothetical protein AAG570_005690 [Ranatra chinensis]|uniref:Fibronectin type-III domain-containing protein n=1 Tax=Ranatra chinensis TaxID=642074 RepID=A0ABD0YLR0_9HEMI